MKQTQVNPDECEFCQGLFKVSELTKETVIEFDNTKKHKICKVHVDEIMELIAKGIL